MEQIRQVAIECVGRAVLFGSLAICCVMIGFSFNPVSAFRSGAMLTLIMAAVLIFKAARANNQNPRHTEVWLYLDDKTRPGDDRGRFAFASVLRDVYARFARVTLAVACLFFAISIGFQAVGFEPFEPPLPMAVAG